MPDQAIAESPEPVEEIVSIPGFGNLREAFDLAMPSTAKTKAPETPEPADKPLLPTEPVKTDPAPATEPQKASESVPESIFEPKKGDEPAPASEPKIEVPAHVKDPQQIKNFEQMRDLYDHAKKELARETAEFTRKLTEAQSKTSDTDAQARIDQLTREKEQLLSVVERRSVEDHPEFKRQITIPKQAAVKEVHQVLQESSVDPVQFDKAMGLTGPAHREAMDAIYDHLPESAKAEVAAAVREIKRLDSRRDAALKDSTKTREQLEREDKIGNHQRLQQYEKQMHDLSQASIAHLRDEKGYEAFKTVDDPQFSTWNSTVEERLADAQALLTKVTDPAQHALAAHLAVACPWYREQMLSYRDKWKGAEAKLAAINGAQPNLNGRETFTAPSAIDEKLSVAEAIARNSGLP